MSNEGQSKKKCSVSSIPSLVGYVGFIASLELCLNLWKLSCTETGPYLGEMRQPIGSYTPKKYFAGRQIIDESFFLKMSTYSYMCFLVFCRYTIYIYIYIYIYTIYIYMYIYINIFKLSFQQYMN